MIEDPDKTQVTPPTEDKTISAVSTDQPHIDGIALDAEIGAGGMGKVYVARQTYLNRQVAVKVLLHSVSREETFTQRFHREAQILAQLDHPHIVRCHEAGVSPTGECYLVMEFIQGTDLKKYIKEHGALPESQVMIIAEQLVEALLHAHEQDIIHRDIKPENILLKEVGENDKFPFVVKLADLGLARPQNRDKQLTMTGSILGTPSTMAPEQFDNPDEVDFRADIYGVGCVLFHCLTGQAAFRETTLGDIIVAKRQAKPPCPRDLKDDVNQEIVSIIEKCLCRNPDDRWTSYEALLQSVRAVNLGTPAKNVQPTAPSAKPISLIIILVIILGAVGAAFFLLNNTDKPTPSSAPTRVQVDTDMGDEESSAPQSKLSQTPTSLWNPGYDDRLAQWEIVSGNWAPDEEHENAVIGFNKAEMRFPVHAQDWLCSVTAESLDIGESSYEFGVGIRFGSKTLAVIYKDTGIKLAGFDEDPLRDTAQSREVKVLDNAQAKTLNFTVKKLDKRLVFTLNEHSFIHQLDDNTVAKELVFLSKAGGVRFAKPEIAAP